MDEKTKRRRMAAMVAKVADLYGERLNVHDPEFNFREIAKQLILLEEHLFHAGKFCQDCIRKHLLAVEALADEIMSLAVPREGEDSAPRSDIPADVLERLVPSDPETVFEHEIQRLSGKALTELARIWLEKFNDGTSPDRIGAEVRLVRKQLVKAIPDPRRELPAVIVAATHTARKTAPCGH